MAVITLRKELARNGRRPGVLLLVVVLGLAVLVATASAMAQSQDPLDLYDANDDGMIDADEAITAVSDHLAGRIDRALALRVWRLFRGAAGSDTTRNAPQACRDYDANRDGTISHAEASNAHDDYVDGIIDREAVLDVVDCYFDGTPISQPPVSIPPPPTPSPPPIPSTPTPPTPTPISSGHQADHTVKLVYGPTPIITPPPAGVPNPLVVVPDSVGIAAAVWNSKMARLNKGLSFCFLSNCDDHAVTIRMNMGDKDTDITFNNDPLKDCAATVACAKKAYVLTEVNPTHVVRHIIDSTIVIEEPAWVYFPNSDPTLPGRHMRVYWTNVSADDYMFSGRDCKDECLFFINATMAHELGHTLGLPDFAKYPGSLGRLKAIMNNVHDKASMTVTNEDLRHLEKIYRDHSAH